MTALISTALLILNLVSFTVIAHVIASWLLNFGIIDRNNRLVMNIWHSLEALLEPIYRPIRNLLPRMGIDLSPLIVLISVHFLRILIGSDLAPLLV